MGPATLARPVAGDGRPKSDSSNQGGAGLADGAWPPVAARARTDTGLAWSVSVLLGLSVVADAFLGLRLLDLINFEPVTPVHLGLAGAVAPLAGGFYWGLRRLGW